MTADARAAGFKDRTRVDAARTRLLDAVDPVERRESVAVAAADRRVLADGVTARRAVPHFDRVEADGYAVRAADTFGASEGAPVTLAEAERVTDEAAVRVRAGAELPDGADAVVPVEFADRTATGVTVTRAVTAGANVGAAGRDAAAGETLFPAGHRLRPADCALLAAAGLEAVPVHERPTVAVIPTGDDLVEADPGPGSAVETDALAVAACVERWGGDAVRWPVVPHDGDALRAAVGRGVDAADLVVTTGGSSVGDRDVVSETVAELGDLLVHGVAQDPGGSVGLGVVEETPVVVLPGPPVACLVGAAQFLRPAVERVARLPERGQRTASARLDRKVASEPGVRTFVRVALDPAGSGDADDPLDGGGGEASQDGLAVASPIRAGGASALSSVTGADGWVVIPEASEGLDAGTRVTVEDWEAVS